MSVLRVGDLWGKRSAFTVVPTTHKRPRHYILIPSRTLIVLKLTIGAREWMQSADIGCCFKGTMTKKLAAAGEYPFSRFRGCYCYERF